jgi:hypothetical protein
MLPCVVASLSLWVLSGGCAPAVARASAPQAPDAPAREASPEAPAATAEAPLYSCAVEVEIRAAERATGRAQSDDPSVAHDLAWQRACEDLRTRTGLECTDESRVRVVKRSSSTRMQTSGDETSATYEQVFELATFERARGRGGSDDHPTAACQAATQAACRAALGTACPAGRVVVLEVVDPPAAPRREHDPSRLTI